MLYEDEGDTMNGKKTKNIIQPTMIGMCQLNICHPLSIPPNTNKLHNFLWTCMFT